MSDDRTIDDRPPAGPESGRESTDRAGSRPAPGGTDERRRPERAGGQGGAGRAEEATPNTALNGLIGGVVTAGTALFVPFSPVLGGAVAGYLEGGDTEDGLKVGALSGLIAMLPLLLVVLAGLAFVPYAIGMPSVVGIVLVVLLIVMLVGAYTVGLGALGGILGAYLEREL